MYYARFEVFMAVAMKNAVLWDVSPYRYFVNRRFGGRFRLHLQGVRNLRAMCLQAPAHVGSSLEDFLYLKDGGETFLRNVGATSRKEEFLKYILIHFS
jgi:hypothetical protein